MPGPGQRAVGNDNSDQTLANRWNGTTWTTQSTPSPGGAAGPDQLNGVSCTSASACIAVGTYATKSSPGHTLVERWNGTTWTQQSTPSPGGPNGTQLNGVSCTSATACIAAGYSFNSTGVSSTLALRYG